MGSSERSKQKHQSRRSKSPHDEERALTAVPAEGEGWSESEGGSCSDSGVEPPPAPARGAVRRRRRTVSCLGPGFGWRRRRCCRRCRGCGWVRDAVEIAVAIAFIYWLARDLIDKHNLTT